jgi:hypothetical protein
LEGGALGGRQAVDVSEQTSEMSEADARCIAAYDMLSACGELLRKRQSEGGIKYLISIHFMLGFCCELYLKGALLQSGMSSNKVRSYRHDLNRLFRDAEAKGPLNSIDKDGLRRVIEILHPGHDGLHYRYIQPGEGLDVIESLSETLTIIGELNKHLRRAIRAQPVTETADSTPRR